MSSVTLPVHALCRLKDFRRVKILDQSSIGAGAKHYASGIALRMDGQFGKGNQMAATYMRSRVHPRKQQYEPQLRFSACMSLR